MPTKIFIDQGHNPRNPNAGAEGNGLLEQDLVFTIGILLAGYLEENGNFTVRLSRPTPQTQLGNSNATSLRARVDAANAWGADYFISLHTNASEYQSATGSEALVFSRTTAAYGLGRDILTGLEASTGLVNRGVKLRPELYVLKKTVMPAVLIELGFISNPGDAALMSGSPELFARGIYEGMLDYLNL